MTTIGDVKGRPTIRVWPEAGQLLGISKDAAYKAAAAGEIPVIRVGRRLLVPTAELLRMLGVSDA